MKTGEKCTGIEVIETERLEQKHKHGYKEGHDEFINKEGELHQAAIAVLKGDVNEMPNNWVENNPGKCEHMAEKGYLERLAIAGALIAAEIDRLP